jgi:hypothetical protein
MKTLMAAQEDRLPQGPPHIRRAGPCPPVAQGSTGGARRGAAGAPQLTARLQTAYGAAACVALVKSLGGGWQAGGAVAGGGPNDD